MGINRVKRTFIVPNFPKIQSMLNKTDIFYQTNKSDSTTGADYYFAKLFLRDSLFIKTTLCINKH